MAQKDALIKTDEPEPPETSDGVRGSAGPATADDGLTTLERERDELHDRLLRVTAEFDNYRKRTDRERRELVEAAAVDLIRDLLPILDDLERALASPASSGAESYRRGVELIHRRLLETLRKRGVEPFEVVGRDFDPGWHEAVAHDPAADGRRDGEITAEIRRGYRIGPRLLRAAQVKVTKA